MIENLQNFIQEIYKILFVLVPLLISICHDCLA